jgi:hypothetical protein
MNLFKLKLLRTLNLQKGKKIKTGQILGKSMENDKTTIKTNIKARK